MAAVSPGSRITHYDTLIRGAEEAYSEYLKESEKLGSSRRHRGEDLTEHMARIHNHSSPIPRS